jgi:peptidoglycan/LPS O-acetylase OafA/YrhL
MGLALIMVSERSFYLHSLRIFSAVIVCIAHAKEFFLVHMEQNASLPEMFIRLTMSLGTSGVLVFFFLSGYLVGGTELLNLIRDKLKPHKYFLDRITRLWVVLLPALFFTYFVNFVSCREGRYSLYCSSSRMLTSSSEIPPMESNGVVTLLQNVFFLQPFRGETWGGNGPLWSLSFEFWYYFLFYFGVLVVSVLKGSNSARFLIIIIPFFVIGISIISREWFVLGIIWVSGAVGRLIIEKLEDARIVKKLQDKGRSKIVLTFVLVILPTMILIRLLPRGISFPILILAMFSTIAIMGNSEIRRKGFLYRTIIHGSGFSFSLYLIHFPLLALFASFFTPVERWHMNLGSLSLIASFVVVCLAFAYLFALNTEFRLKNLRLRLSHFYGK